VDGNDAVAVGEAAQKAIDRARKGGGPTIVEGLTFRIYGHHLGDPGTGYRKEEDVEEAKKRAEIPGQKTIKYGLIHAIERLLKLHCFI
jgi:pyruvate dehydrogenase E1 component alpha subunit